MAGEQDGTGGTHRISPDGIEEREKTQAQSTAVLSSTVRVWSQIYDLVLAAQRA